ncbi:MAG: tetratricopeptide repeat protein [Gammaproteobacteria bacterium]|nr:tetratricopeptide repeat protein [Gammaproteobacteria bacterium]
MADSRSENQEDARQALLQLQRGDAAGAERLSRAMLARSPDRLDARATLGLALSAQGRPREAVAAFEELVRLQPDVAAWWINLGTFRRQLGQYDEALADYARAAALGERSGSFFYNVGLLHIDRGDYDSARQVLADASAAAPRDAPVRIEYAQCCHDSMRVEEAVRALHGWELLEGLDAGHCASIALLYLTLGEQAAARAALARAEADPQPGAQALLRIAQFHERSNDVAGAEAALARLRSIPEAAALGEDLELLEAQLAQRNGRLPEAVASFARLAAGCREPHRRHLHLFPLAKALDAAGRYDEALAALREAHAAQMLHVRRTNPGVAEQREPPLAITRHGCDPRDVAAWDETDAPAAADSPIFIVAFPRSGTTLLEQMLDAHPGLVTMDEQPYLQQAIDRIGDFAVRYPSGLAALSREQLALVRERYWELTRRKVTLAPGQRLIDKNPLNLLRLPAIQRLFPNARILLAVRHPCDVVLSCYQQHFRAPEFALICRDLPTLARSYARAFDFWFEQAAILEPAVLEVRYEALVAAFEGGARAIADFLEVPWHDALLEPARHARERGYISTPSYSQVIEPVHGRSVGRWRRYEAAFAEALPALGSQLGRWGYDA